LHFLAEKFGGKAKKSYICTNKMHAYMKRTLLLLSVAGFLMAVAPMAVQASEMSFAAVEQTEDQVEVNIEGQTVTITGAQGKKLIVVSLTGRQVLTVNIESPAQRVDLNIPKGCYILKVGKVVRKVQVR
jgi:hypothetical protein